MVNDNREKVQVKEYSSEEPSTTRRTPKPPFRSGSLVRPLTRTYFHRVFDNSLASLCLHHAFHRRFQRRFHRRPAEITGVRDLVVVGNLLVVSDRTAISISVQKPDRKVPPRRSSAGRLFFAWFLAAIGSISNSRCPFAYACTSKRALES